MADLGTVPPPVVDVFSLVDTERHMTPVEYELLKFLETAEMVTLPARRSDV